MRSGRKQASPSSALTASASVAIILLVMGAALQRSRAEAPEPSVPAPFAPVPWGLELPELAFEERLPDGTVRELAFAEMRGEPLVIVLWATWCGICAREMPKLDRLAASLEPKGIRVVAMSIDDGGSTVPERYLQKKGLRSLRVFLDKQKVLFPTLGAWGVPTAVIAGPDGRIVARATGPVAWNSEPVLRYLLKQRLVEPNPRT